MKYKILFLLIVSVAVSCNQSSGPIKTSVTGAPGDILLVINDKLWQSAAGDTIHKILTAPVEALPQDEPRFDVIKINHDRFDGLMKRYRNIVVVKVGSDQPDPKVLVQHDPWARPQLLITILAPDESAFMELMAKNDENIRSLIVNTDLKNLSATFARMSNQDVTSRLNDDYHLSLVVPKEYKIGRSTGDFLWISQEYRAIIQSILVYTYPYTDKNTFTRDYLVNKRNEFLKKYLPGEIEGSFMTTEKLFPPIFKEYEMNGKYTAELRGLWRVENGLIMGGPFVSISQVDEKRNRIVTVEGFVYAAGQEKRDLMQQVEAIIYSLKIQ